MSSWEPACRVVSGTRTGIAGLFVGVLKLLSLSSPTLKPLKQFGVAHFEARSEVAACRLSSGVVQACELREVFEEVNGKKDCLERCVTAMPGAFKKSQISRQLKAMGLKRNRLTESQVGSSTLHHKWGAGAHTRLMWARLG